MDISVIAKVPGLLEEHRLPGLAVGVCTADSVLWAGGFGVTRAGGDVPIGTETMFSVQSCSKMYTATAVLHAVREGLVEMDEPIVRYLPEFRVRSAFEEDPERRITVRHLLSHTAGFTHEAPVGSNYVVGRESFEEHCRSIYQTWLRFPVGERFEYSNLGIDLAGYILQRRSGLPFHEYVRRVLFEPLGLERTSFDARVIVRERDRAIGHSKGYLRLPVRVPMVAAGGLYTSVADACRYVQFHLTEAESLAELYEGKTYGLGVALAEANGIPVRGHGGGGFGFLSDMYWAPEAGIGVVVLTNSTAHPLHWKLACDIFREVVGTTAAEDGPWNRDYAIHVSGVRDGTARLRKVNGIHLFEHWNGQNFPLREHQPGLYISSNGEMLDLTQTPPTYANVRLHELSEPGA
ncbi:serine hydrolase domain-containing protein [Kribbella sp.]|uniref:serine hydrolase domain-containing protein n=1 Tax=Kribbella sp. TaxID=1871183 RepID=UPI002D6BC2A4|nr:serine hydrolase domain-containing protein [Kribbella sp.]HZX05460.1 serine hydrolase domain-containing protein [Kribbella sp.]